MRRNAFKGDAPIQIVCACHIHCLQHWPVHCEPIPLVCRETSGRFWDTRAYIAVVGCRAALLVLGPCIHFSCICACAIAHAHMALVVGAPGITNLFPFGVWPALGNCRFWCAMSFLLAGHAGAVCLFAALRELCVWLPACARARSRTRGHLPGYFPLFT